MHGEDSRARVELADDAQQITLGRAHRDRIAQAPSEARVLDGDDGGEPLTRRR